MHDDETSRPTGALAQPEIDVLVANHRDFLRFVERRVGDRATAEEIVQDAFVRSLDWASAACRTLTAARRPMSGFSTK